MDEREKSTLILCHGLRIYDAERLLRWDIIAEPFSLAVWHHFRNKSFCLTALQLRLQNTLATVPLPSMRMRYLRAEQVEDA